MLYLQLFISFIQIGLFSFGGGYVAMPLITAEIVVRRGWITMETFTTLFAISEMTPGPIAINAATFVGMQMGGIPGAMIASLGYCTAPFTIVSLLAWLYKRYRDMPAVQSVLSGIRPAVVGMIATSALTLLNAAFWPGGRGAEWFANTDFLALGVFAAGLYCLRKWKPSPVLIITGAALFGGLLHFIG